MLASVVVTFMMACVVVYRERSVRGRMVRFERTKRREKCTAYLPKQVMPRYQSHSIADR